MSSPLPCPRFAQNDFGAAFRNLVLCGSYVGTAHSGPTSPSIDGDLASPPDANPPQVPVPQSKVVQSYPATVAAADVAASG